MNDSTSQKVVNQNGFAFHLVAAGSALLPSVTASIDFFNSSKREFHLFGIKNRKT